MLRKVSNFQYRNIVGHNILRTFGHSVAACCDVLRHVGRCWLNLKMVKFFMQHLRMLHDVVVVWPGSYNTFALRHARQFDFQYPTRPNRVAKRTQHVAPNNAGIHCVQLLRSFGRSLQILSHQCWDMLRSIVAIVQPGLSISCVNRGQSRSCERKLTNRGELRSRKPRVARASEDEQQEASRGSWLPLCLFVYGVLTSRIFEQSRDCSQSMYESTTLRNVWQSLRT